MGKMLDSSMAERWIDFDLFVYEDGICKIISGFKVVKSV
jgi:hypothetical protein